MSKESSTAKSWMAQSIMDQRGLAQGRIGETHELTPERQGKYHYTIGPYSDPVLTIKPGDRVVFWTQACSDGPIKNENDLPSQTREVSFLNPQSGPAIVEGAE